jgi:hypothetical protein
MYLLFLDVGLRRLRSGRVLLTVDNTDPVSSITSRNPASSGDSEELDKSIDTLLETSESLMNQNLGQSTRSSLSLVWAIRIHDLDMRLPTPFLCPWKDEFGQWASSHLSSEEELDAIHSRCGSFSSDGNDICFNISVASPGHSIHRHRPLGSSDHFTYLYTALFTLLGFWLPLSDLVCSILRELSIAPTQLHLRGWDFIRCFEVVCACFAMTPSVGVFFSFFRSEGGNALDRPFVFFRHPWGVRLFAETFEFTVE